MELNIHTIFRKRENILFMEEWIHYHLTIGFDMIYLYDNSKSIGEDGSSPTINKYNINFSEITKFITEDELEKRLSSILQKFNGHVKYKIWQPIDENGNVTYHFQEAVLDYVKDCPDNNVWTAFIDMDEFIYCKEDLRNSVKNHQDSNVVDIVLFQKKFDDRFNNLSAPITEVVSCIEGIDTSSWAPKHLVKNSNIDLHYTDFWNMHMIPMRNGRVVLENVETFRFNHYNVNNELLKWMKEFYNSEIDFELNGQCYQLFNRYQELKT